MIEWIDAVAFCEWLSKKEGKSYRLPTEAEWEYACRAGTTTRYHSGDDPETLVAVANVRDATAAAKFERFSWALKAPDGYVFTSPVGRFKPNAFGLYDMHGSAYQWCSNWFKLDYYSESPVDDPTGPGVGYRNRVAHVLRGGSWYSRPWECARVRGAGSAPRAGSVIVPAAAWRVCVDPSDDLVKRAAANRPPVAKGVKVTVERIASRPWGKESVVAVQLKVSGPEVANARPIRTLIAEGTDDADIPLRMSDTDDQFKVSNRNESGFTRRDW